MTCSYELTSFQLPPCLIFTHQVYKNLPVFINKTESIKFKNELLTKSIDCIAFDMSTKSITINEDQCISCGACAFSCPGSRINFDNDLKAIPSCSTFNQHRKSEKKQIKEKLIDLSEETLDSPNSSSYKSFEAFTAVNETKNISIWAANTLKYLFDIDKKMGLEIPLTIAERDRNGRLDICLLSDDVLIVVEAKVGLKKMIAEDRYISQILAYDEEISRLDIVQKYGKIAIKLLLIGDNEKDLLPPDHALCSSKVGNLSKTFYESILKYQIQFISARGLLSLAMAKLTNPTRLIDKIFIDTFKDPNTVGILSNTLIKRNGNEIYLKSLNL
jgi:NAD-dependent dihydropyrimidine dehydrogenase PreA subunit